MDEAAASTMDNPVLRADVEAGSGVVTLTAEQLGELKEQIKTEVRAELRENYSSPSGSLDANDTEALALAIRSTVAKLDEAPTGYHQGTAYFLAHPEQTGTWTPALMGCGSFIMVIGQIMAVGGVWLGTVVNSCASNDQCKDGFFCSLGGGVAADRCIFCGNDGAVHGQSRPDDLTNTTLTSTICSTPYQAWSRPDRSGTVQIDVPARAIESWCEVCIMNDGTVDPLYLDSYVSAHRSAMGVFDWVALTFCTCIVGFTVVAELKDIMMCSIAIDREGEKIPPFWQIVLHILNGMRRYLFLPLLVWTVPCIVLFQGGDALSVAFNSVAILFLCEVDNALFKLALGERARSLLEANAHVAFEEADLTILARTKAVHVPVIVLTVLVGVESTKYNMFREAVFVLFFGWWIGAIAEVWFLDANAQTIAKRVGMKTACIAMGMLGIQALWSARRVM